MANITPQNLFPSAKFISTKANGDLNEVHGIDAVKASLIVDKLVVDAVDAGADGNNITFEIVDTGRTIGNTADFSVVGNDVVCDVKLTTNGNLQTANNVAVSFFNNAPQEVKDLINITTLGGLQDSATLSSHTHAQANLENGADEQTTSDLDGSSTYLLIKTDEIADLQVSEQADGRKVLFGLLETASTNFGNLADPSQYLKVSVSNPIYNSATNTIYKTYLTECTLSFSGLDLKNES
jgi:hypothetical protein